MSFDEAFKSVLISTQAKLSLQSEHFVIKQDIREAKIFLKDIYFIILESPQILITSALLSALAEYKIVLLTCDKTHHINGIFSSYLGHFQSAKIAKQQVALSKQKKSILWQKIIKNKITNQAHVLHLAHKIKESKKLLNISKNVTLGDSKNQEAVAAALYFKALFGKDFYREDINFINSALNYGYAIIRACIVRSVCVSGLLTWQGIKHDNMYNHFNLCDDLIEVFRPWVDLCVLDLNTPNKDSSLQKEDRKILIDILQHKVIIEGQKHPLNRAINRYVQSFRSALLEEKTLVDVAFES